MRHLSRPGTRQASRRLLAVAPGSAYAVRCRCPRRIRSSPAYVAEQAFTMTPQVRRRSGEIARVAAGLAAGEQLAHEIATRQAPLAGRPACQRFFAAQACQERAHARVFRGASELLAPGCDAPPLAADQIAALRAR